MVASCSGAVLENEVGFKVPQPRHWNQLMLRLPLLFVTLIVAVLSGCGRRPAGPPVPGTPEISASGDDASSAAAAESADETPSGSPDAWPSWRGGVDGIARGPAVPTTWSKDEHVVWRTKIPGRGHSSPIIHGDRIYLETADEQAETQSVVCLNRENGEQLWQRELHKGNLERQMHPENSQATSTLLCDGKRVIAVFLNDRKIWVIALDLDGKELWRTEAGSFSSKFGYSASPVPFGRAVIIAADHQQGGFLASIDRVTGKILWRKARPERSSYATPRIVDRGANDQQLVIAGCRLLASYNPRTGEQLWATDGTAESAVGTPVVWNDLVLASGGYPEQDTLAVKPDGSVAWRKDVKAYCTSMLVHADHLYFVSDDGIARCHDLSDGREKWKQRLGGNFRVSPILSGDNIYITSMAGKTTVFRADPTKFIKVAENQVGDEGFASPAVSAGRLYLRTAEGAGGSRQEWLYCIGE